MNSAEHKLVNTLIDLKEKYHVVGVKAEFETEGTEFEEAEYLKKIVTNAGLDLTIKIGGCEAIKDMVDAKNIGANAIVAPMIESPYAVKKYVQAIKNVFNQQEIQTMKFFINIETKYGFNYIDDILKSDFSKYLSGIVFGRTDMAGSLDIDINDINNEIIFEYARELANKVAKYNKEFIIGGGVSVLSLPFFKALPSNMLTKFETRKIIFNAKQALEDNNIEEGILNAINFELMWIKNKQKQYGVISKEDARRVMVLESRCKNSISKFCKYISA